MQTHLITRLDFDPERLAVDVAKARSFAYNDSYSDFVCGQQRICMLFNRTGSLKETHISQYDRPAKPTRYWDQLPYLSEVIEGAFDLAPLRFARLLQLTPNSVMIPHRDYLEFNRRFCRIHVPLRTDAACYTGESEVVFQMRMGEVWYLNATNVHSAASFSSDIRTHLVLDFADTDDVTGLLKLPCNGDGSIPSESIVVREPMSDEDEEAIRALGRVVDPDNYQDILAVLIKRYYRRQVPAAEVFEWASEVVSLSANPTLVERLAREKDYYLRAR